MIRRILDRAWETYYLARDAGPMALVLVVTVIAGAAGLVWLIGREQDDASRVAEVTGELSPGEASGPRAASAPARPAPAEDGGDGGGSETGDTTPGAREPSRNGDSEAPQVGADDAPPFAPGESSKPAGSEGELPPALEQILGGGPGGGGKPGYDVPKEIEQILGDGGGPRPEGSAPTLEEMFEQAGER